MSSRRVVNYYLSRSHFIQKTSFPGRNPGRIGTGIHRTWSSATETSFTRAFVCSKSTMSSGNGSVAIAPEAGTQEKFEECTTTAATPSEKISPAASTASSSPSKKRKKTDWFGSKKKRGGGKKDGKTKNCRKPTDPESLKDQTPHGGSFANESMRKLFGIEMKEPASNSSVPEKPESDAQVVAEAEENNTNEEGNDSNTTTSSGRYPKRKVALLLAFVGEKYAGFQMNPGQNTIQARVEVALYHANLLSKDNFGYPGKYQWSSSARTDKGVHACAQVCSVKIQCPSMDMDVIREAINEQLPSDVRVLDVVRTTRSFHARTQRDRVRYQYMLPTFLLQDRQKARALFESYNCHENDLRPGELLTPEQVKLLQKDLASFRIDKDRAERLRTALATYEGTHLFHNFTSGKTSQDANSTRYIVKFEMQDPVVLEDGTEWIVTNVTGQSFLLHQIRKMISLAVDVARGSAELDLMKHAMSKHQVRLNIAPAQGLFLDMSFFGHYNKKNKQGEDLNWTPPSSADENLTPAMARWKDFKENIVERHIVKEEARDANFIKYLFVQEYVFEFEQHYQITPEEGKDEGKSAGDAATTG